MVKKREKTEKKENRIDKKEQINHEEPKSENKTEKMLVENFVAIQHVMTNLAIKLDNLSNQISKLLELFEISAKTLAEKGVSEESKADKKVVEKLDSLIEQNKVIARGITLLHEKDSENQYPSSQNMQRYSSGFQPQQGIPNSKNRNMSI